MKRRCFLTDEHVFFAEERAKRPHSFKKVKIANTPKEFCPFCLENEKMTPPEVYSTADKKIRIVPNKYPFVTIDKDCFGVHDVLIDTDEHDRRLCTFTDEQMHELMKVIKFRVGNLEEDERLEYIQVFKNQGIDAGASQSHSHWQIAGLSVVPEKINKIMNKLSDFKKETGKCYFCSLNHEERIVEEDENFIVYCPYDSKFSYEMYIIPRAHNCNFKNFSDEELFSLGKIIRNSVYRLAQIYEGISYNICFYNMPVNAKGEDSFHFFIQIIPRIGQMAGFEFSTGCFISSVLPENAAVNLRNIKIEGDFNED